MSSLPPTAFDNMLQQLGELPLWVKQVLYTQLRRELEAALSKSTLDAFGPDHTLQLWTPELSYQGLSLLEKPAGANDPKLLKLLQLIRSHKNIINITLLNNWSLETCATILAQALDKQLIGPPKSNTILGTIEYLAGRSRLGEYLVKINRLNLEQLNQALQTQRAIEEAMGERTGLANVLINLGYIKKEDSEGILFLKRESRKVIQMPIFQLNAAPPPSGGLPPASLNTLQQLQGQLQQAMQYVRQLEMASQPFQ